mgnify:CR=1 FL=1
MAARSLPVDLNKERFQLAGDRLVRIELRRILVLVLLLTVKLVLLLAFEHVGNALSQAVDVFVVLVADLPQGGDLVLLLGLRLLSLHGLAHTVGNGGLVECLVG